MLFYFFKTLSDIRASRTHIVAVFKRSCHLVVHAVLFHGHEERVDDDTERDKEVDERVHDKELDDVRELVPASAALPAEQQLMTLALQEFLLAHAFLEPEIICDDSDITVLDSC